jgi:mRNA interferase MazF
VLVVSRQRFIDSSYSKVVCVPVYSTYGGLESEVKVGPELGLKHDSSLRADEVLSVGKSQFRQHVGTASPETMRAVGRALAIALDIRPEDIEDL